MLATSVTRLSSTSTCLYATKLCERAATRSETLFRSYATVPSSSNSGDTASKHQKAAFLANSLDASTSDGTRVHSPRPLKYPSTAIQLTSRTSKKKKFKSKNHPPPKSANAPLMQRISTALSPSSNEQMPELKPTAEESDDDNPLKDVPIIRLKMPSARMPKKEKPTVVRPSEEVPTVKPVLISLEASEKNLSQADDASLAYGPGFIEDNWTPESWESEEGKRAPPHFVPTVNIKQDTIGEVEGLVDVAAPTEQLPIAKLAHGLDRVLFNPGVHWLQDPRSHVYNFTPWIEKIPKVNDFAFEKLTGFIKSSQDEDLRTLAKQEQKKFTGSTSSLSGMFSHIYFLISEHKDVEMENLSQHFSLESAGFTLGQRMPSGVTLKYKDGIYSADALGSEQDDPDKNVLTWMGTLLENFLTKSPEEFKKFMRLESEPTGTAQKQLLREAFRFSKSDKFVMRSQLDCQDDRLPGTGVFDIKTRACISVRMDILNFEENSGYAIKNQHGILESFEREYYDLMRSAFLKYSVQVRIGNMDGVIVAYHNTERIFGFQYISLDEMDERIYGPVPGIGAKVFKKSITLLESVLEEATKCYPEQSIVCLFETRRPGKLMDVYVQPDEWKGKGPKPVTQFLVQIEHLVDGKPARAAVALRTTTEDWTMKYSIAKAVLPDDVVKHNLHSAERRKSRTLVLPSSVTLDQAKKYWENLTYNPKLQAVTTQFKPNNFTIADAAIQKYRDISNEGRTWYEELQKQLAGKPKIVLGEGVYEEDESLSLQESQPDSQQEPKQEAQIQAESHPDSRQQPQQEVQAQAEFQIDSQQEAQQELQQEAQAQTEQVVPEEDENLPLRESHLDSQQESQQEVQTQAKSQPDSQQEPQAQTEPSPSEPESDLTEKKE